MPVEQASTVHLSATTTGGTPGEGGWDTITIQDDLALADVGDRLVLLDLHEEVNSGYVVLRTDTALVTCANLQIAVTNVAGDIQGAANPMGPIGGNDITGGGNYSLLCHAHIPTTTGSDSVFVVMIRSVGTPETIPAHSTITTTIASINDAIVP